jgi:hypothetical protein
MSIQNNAPVVRLPVANKAAASKPVKATQAVAAEAPKRPEIELKADDRNRGRITNKAMVALAVVGGLMLVGAFIPGWSNLALGIGAVAACAILLGGAINHDE